MLILSIKDMLVMWPGTREQTVVPEAKEAHYEIWLELSSAFRELFGVVEK